MSFLRSRETGDRVDAIDGFDVCVCAVFQICTFSIRIAYVLRNLKGEGALERRYSNNGEGWVWVWPQEVQKRQQGLIACLESVEVLLNLQYVDLMRLKSSYV